tara:strand:- start:1295 stop:1645 length:351 start_codon:yes stop_codon:yes gene_type:complete
MLIFAVLWVMSIPFYNFAVNENILLKTLMQIYLYLIIQFFFVWFWVKNGETLGMKTWKIKIVNEDGNKISYKQGVTRFNVAIISLLIFGLGFLIAIFNKERKCLHDIISKTILIKH